MRKNIFLSLLFAGVMSASLVEGRLSESDLTIAMTHINGLASDKRNDTSLDRVAELYEQADNNQKYSLRLEMEDIGLKSNLEAKLRARSQSRDSTRSSSPASTQKPTNQRVDKGGFESITLKNQNTAYKNPVQTQKATKHAAPASNSSAPKSGSSAPKKSALEMAEDATSDDQAQIYAADANRRIKEINSNQKNINSETAKIYYDDLNQKEYIDNIYVEYDIQDVLKQLKTIIDRGSKSSMSTPTNTKKAQKPAAPASNSSAPKKSALEMAEDATSDDQAQMDAADANRRIKEINSNQKNINSETAKIYYDDLNQKEYIDNIYVEYDIQDVLKQLKTIIDRGSKSSKSTATNNTKVQKSTASKELSAATQAQKEAADEANDMIQQVLDNKKEIDYEVAKKCYEFLNQKEYIDNKYVNYDVKDVLTQLQTVIDAGPKSSKSAPVTERSKVSKTRVKKPAPTQKKTGRMTLEAVKGKIKNIVEDFVKNKKEVYFNDEVDSLKENVLSNKSIKMTGKQFENMVTLALIKGWELKRQKAKDYTAICDVRNHFIDNGLKVGRCLMIDNENLVTHIKNLLSYVRYSDYDYGNQKTKEQQKQPRFRDAFGELNSKQLDRISTYAIEKLAPLMKGKITEEERQELLDELFQHTAVFKEAAKKIGYDKVAAAIHNDKKRPLEVIIEATFVAKNKGETSRAQGFAESLRKISKSPIFKILHTSNEVTRMMIDHENSGKKSNKKTDLDKKAADVSKQKKSKDFSGDDSETDIEVSFDGKIVKDSSLSSNASDTETDTKAKVRVEGKIVKDSAVSSDMETDTEVSFDGKIVKDSAVSSDTETDTEAKVRVEGKIKRDVTEQRRNFTLRRTFKEDRVG